MARQTRRDYVAGGTVLRFQEGRSDKVYVVVSLPQIGMAVRGHGKYGACVNWGVVSEAEGQKLLRQKRAKGYEDCPRYPIGALGSYDGIKTGVCEAYLQHDPSGVLPDVVVGIGPATSKLRVEIRFPDNPVQNLGHAKSKPTESEDTTWSEGW